MKSLLEKEFGFKVDHVKELNGYDNKNYKVTQGQNQYVFKTYKAEEELFQIVNGENLTLSHLKETMGDRIPVIVPFQDKAQVKQIEIDSELRICRMLSFLEGRFLGDVQHSKTLFNALGHFLAQLDRSLQNHQNVIFKARQWEWDLQYFDLNRKYIEDIPNAHDRNIVRYFFNQFEEKVRPLFPELRKQIIHNDANEWNILVDGDSIKGIIDFGDLAHSFLINELAIALTYACYDKEDPLEWAIPIIESYHTILPLEEKELHILYYLIAARLCTSVCNSAHAKKADPENTYASVSEEKAWQMLKKWLSINPIKADNIFRKAAGMEPLLPSPIEKVLEKRRAFFGENLSLSYSEPIHMAGAAFQYMYDTDGNTYLDAYNNIPHVGHSHPKVVTAGQKQMAQLNTNTRYLFDELAAYAEKLLAHFPETLCKVFFVNSGSAASDLAIRLAHAHTKAKHIMVMEDGYHGNTQTSIDISHYKYNNPKGEGQKEHIIKTPLPNTYKGTYAGHPNAGSLYAQEAIAQIINSPEPLAAFICEPVVGCAGQIPLAERYLQEVYPAIRAQGGVCISDEVQTGFGRMGDHFWGYEAQGVVPDIVVLGKPIANGHPMGAVVCTAEIADSFSQGVEFFSSFGGNPVSCAIASAVLEVIEEEALQENARTVGEYYRAQLRELAKKHPCIGDVRGLGLFIGVEIVQEGTTKPDTPLAHHIKNEMRKAHILISTDGPFDNILKTKPPLCFSKKNADTVVAKIDEILTSFYTLNKPF